MSVTLRHLRCFTAVCETGSMTAAAERLFMAQPSVSLAVSEMEAHYGVKLFDRIARRIYLTDSGRQVLAYARHVTELLDELEHQVKNPEGTGCLRLGTSITVGACLLPRCVRRMKEAFPALRVEAVIANSEAIEQRILENEIDLGMIEGTVHSSYIRSEDFGGDQLVFICPPGHALAGREAGTAELKSGEFLLRERGSAARERFEALMAARELAVRPLWESVSNQAILQGVKAGLGLSLLPRELAGEALKRGELAEFFVPGVELSRRFHLIFHKNKYLPQSARFLAELLGEEK